MSPYFLQLDLYKTDHHLNLQIYDHTCHLLTDFILSKASPQTHLTEFFSVALFPISPKCLLQTSTTSGSSSYQSIKLNFLRIHSLATPPSPPPIIAALSLSLFKFKPAQQK